MIKYKHKKDDEFDFHDIYEMAKVYDRGEVLSMHDYLVKHKGRKNANIDNDRYVKSMYRYIVDELIDLMLNDIVYNNVSVGLVRYYDRVNPYLSLLIADRQRKSRRYRYDIRRGGRQYIPYAITSRHLFKTGDHKLYEFRIGDTWVTKFKEEVKRGHAYDLAPRVSYKGCLPECKKKRTYNTRQNIINKIITYKDAIQQRKVCKPFSDYKQTRLSTERNRKDDQFRRCH